MLDFIKANFRSKNARQKEAYENGYKIGAALFAEIDELCAVQLGKLAALEDEDWNKLIEEKDYKAIIIKYCGAMAGIEDSVREFFNTTEENMRKSAYGCDDFTKSLLNLRRLQYTVQIHTYMRNLLKISVVPDEKTRREMHETARSLLNISFCRTF